MNTKLSLAVALLATVFAAGCSSTPTSFVPSAGAPEHTSTRSSEAVEVLLDSAPTRPFKVVGELESRTASSVHSVKAMKERAAAAGLDGIYWIDCTSPCSGQCTAKGFVYLDGTKMAGR